MTRLVFVLLAMVCTAQAFENRGLRRRVAEIEAEYETFMSRKVDGVALRDKVLPGTFAVFGAKGHRLACAGLK